MRLTAVIICLFFFGAFIPVFSAYEEEEAPLSDEDFFEQQIEMMRQEELEEQGRFEAEGRLPAEEISEDLPVGDGPAGEEPAKEAPVVEKQQETDDTQGEQPEHKSWYWQLKKATQ
ncbi:MAG: hypothetical protein PHR44_01080 [Candidatus Omnitrophica bacterium]|nr:hypothetical protein [Candidatus Omnitrophota bacterium]